MHGPYKNNPSGSGNGRPARPTITTTSTSLFHKHLQDFKASSLSHLLYVFEIYLKNSKI